MRGASRQRSPICSDLSAAFPSCSGIKCAPWFLIRQFDTNDVYELRNWRRNIAHSVAYFDEIEGRSLSTRVCSGDAGLFMSSTQANTYKNLKAYLGTNPGSDIPLGMVMAVISLLAWFLTCCKEVAPAAVELTYAVGRFRLTSRLSHALALVDPARP